MSSSPLSLSLGLSVKKFITTSVLDNVGLGSANGGPPSRSAIAVRELKDSFVVDYSLFLWTSLVWIQKLCENKLGDRQRYRAVLSPTGKHQASADCTNPVDVRTSFLLNFQTLDCLLVNFLTLD
eukprot:gene25553-biopygen2268